MRPPYFWSCIFVFYHMEKPSGTWQTGGSILLSGHQTKVHEVFYLLTYFLKCYMNEINKLSGYNLNS